MTPESEMDEVLGRVKELRARLSQWAKEYYIDDAPTVPDSVYDSVYTELRNIEEEYPGLITPDSPTQKIIGKVVNGLKQVKHTVPMISLRTETDITMKPVKDFMVKCLTLAKTKEYIAEPKYDGLSLRIVYRKGVAVLAATRGDGEEGEDVTHNLPAISGIPMQIPDFSEELEVRGEVMMPKGSFNRLNREREEKGLPLFANCRNAAAGSLRQLDSSECYKRGLIFVPFGISRIDGDKLLESTQFDLLMYLSDLGFQVDRNILVFEKESEYEEYRDSLEKRRPGLEYDIDGIVIKVNSIREQDKLGTAAKEPRWAIAHKFSPEQARSDVRSIEIQIGRTGKLTPVAKLTPVVVGGVTVSSITLHNVFTIREKGVRVGDNVIVQRAGDVIPEIVGLTPGFKREGYVPNFKMPHKCPSCGSVVLRPKGEADYRCQNDLDCPARLDRRILHFVSREAMDIHGLGEETVSELISLGLVISPTDIYKLTMDDLLRTSLGPKEISNLLNAIEKSRDVTMSRFLFALGIRHVGIGTSKDLARQVPSIYELSKMTREELLALEDIGPKTADSLLSFFNTEGSKAMLMEFDFLNVIPKSEYKEKVKGLPLEGYTFVLTGTFTRREGEPVKRQKLEHVLQQLGAKVSGSVSAKTTAVIKGEGGGEKSEKAEKLGVTVVPFRTLMQWISHKTGDLALEKVLFEELFKT